MFEVDQVLFGRIPTGDDVCRFDFNILEEAMKRMIKDKLGEVDVRMDAINNLPTPNCPTFVVAKTQANINAPPTVFRTYRSHQVRPSQCFVWQAARATSAAPTFFKPISIDRPRPAITYIDGGMGYNNPSELALNEAKRLWPGSTGDEFGGCTPAGTTGQKSDSVFQIQCTPRCWRHWIGGLV